MKMSEEGLELIKQSEGFKMTPYDDGAGFMTIGFGHKIKSGEHFTSLTRDQAESLLMADVIEVENFIDTHVKVPLSQSQYDALCSFVFNVRRDAVLASTLLKELNNGR
jgi:lysozyme